jgi:Tfp pilus assembly protein FimT
MEFLRSIRRGPAFAAAAILPFCGIALRVTLLSHLERRFLRGTMTDPMHQECRSRRDRERGFSGLELAIVVFIISAMSLLALPELLSARENYRLLASAQEISGNIANARIRSINENADFRIRVDTLTSYVLEEETAPGTWTQRGAFESPDGYTFSASGSTIEFHFRGNATPVATLTLQNPNSLTRNIVTTTAGRTNVQ